MMIISVILGSTRQGPISEKPAQWILQHLRKREGIEVEPQAAFVSYGGAMGARSVQQLRQIAIELQLAPIRSSVHIPPATLWAHMQGGDVTRPSPNSTSRPPS